MGVETATYINDFDGTLPTATDLRSQGDDHIRLLKTVLKTAFTGATRTFQIPGVLAKTADYTVVKADGESTVYCTTAAGACTFTLPSLAALDAGWKIHFIKTNSGANPMFIAPPSGTINSGGISGLAKARRSIPGIRVTAIWDGTGWFVTRAIADPIGTTLNFTGTALPAGFEWPNGQTLSSSVSYPEYNSAMGALTTLDLRGRVEAGKDDMGGSAAGRLTAASGISGTTLGSTAGVETRTLLNANLPAYTPAGSISGTVATVFQNISSPAVGVTKMALAAAGGDGATGAGNTLSATFAGSAQGGASTAFAILQPTIICNKILVVE